MPLWGVSTRVLQQSIPLTLTLSPGEGTIRSVMADSVIPGPQCQYNKPQVVGDGTIARVPSAPAAPLNRDGESAFAALWRRVGYVEEAFARGARQAPAMIAGQLGREFRNAIDAIIFGMVLMMGTLTTTTLGGAAIGAGVGALAGGAGAIPGAALGADFGLTIGEGILAWLGLAVVGSYVVSNFASLTARFRLGVNLAWGSDGDDAALNLAAGEIAGGVALFCGLTVQGIVLWITEAAASTTGAAAMSRLRDKLIFQRCPKLEA